MIRHSLLCFATLACLLPGALCAQTDRADITGGRTFPTYQPPVGAGYDPSVSTIEPHQTVFMSERDMSKVTSPGGNPGAILDLHVSKQLRKFTIQYKLDTADQVQNSVTLQTLPKENFALNPHISVPSIHEVTTDSIYFKGLSNPALVEEVHYLNWGATTGEQLDFRRGNYFTFTIANHWKSLPLTIVFQYRQVNSQESIRTLTESLPKFSGGARAYFAVIGPAYRNYGPVSSWRLLIKDGDQVIGQLKSAIW